MVASDTEATTEVAAATEEETTTEAAPASSEVTYAADMYGKQFNISIEVPDGANYEFTVDKPVDESNIDGGAYLKSDKIVAAFATESYDRYGDSTSTNFSQFVEYMKGGNRPIVGETEIGGKSALQLEHRWGSGSGDLHGYKYFIDASDVLGEGQFVNVTVITADSGTDNVESTFSDSEVQDVINSFKFSN